jgi:sporulation protein YqfC
VIYLKIIKIKTKSKSKKVYKEILKEIKNKTSKKSSQAINAISDFLEIPKELISKSTKVTIIENSKILVEGYNQILDYYDNYIKIKANSVNLMIDGKNLDIKEITDSDLIIQGEIYSINYKG